MNRRVIAYRTRNGSEEVRRELEQSFDTGIKIIDTDDPTEIACELHDEPVGSVQCDPATVALIANGIVIVVEGKKLASDIIEYIESKEGSADDVTDEFDSQG